MIFFIFNFINKYIFVVVMSLFEKICILGSLGLIGGYSVYLVATPPKAKLSK